MDESFYAVFCRVQELESENKQLKAEINYLKTISKSLDYSNISVFTPDIKHVYGGEGKRFTFHQIVPIEYWDTVNNIDSVNAFRRQMEDNFLNQLGSWLHEENCIQDMRVDEEVDNRTRTRRIAISGLVKT